MKKRLLAFCLTLCLLVGLLPTAALAAGDTWTDEVTEKPEGYTVENSGDVTISSAEGLAWLAKQVNKGTPFSGKTITLSENIDLSAHEWVPIGTQTYPFDGTFDGDGNTISGMDVVVRTDSPVAGLFGIVSECTIKDTTLVGARITGTVVGPEEPNDNDWNTANDYLDTMIGGIAAANKKASSDPNTVTIQGCDVEELSVKLVTNCGVDVSIGGILGKTDDFRSSKANIIDCNADIAVTYQSNTDDNRTYIGGAIGELCSPKHTNVLENGNFSLSVTIPQNAAELVEFRYSIGGAIGYMGTFSNSLVDPIVHLRDISCHSTLDFSRTQGILPNSIPIFEANFSAGGMIGRGSDFHMERCFAMIDLSGPENEKPTDFGNLVGFTQNTDTITCDKVYTYAIRYQGVNTYYENEECASNLNWSVAKNIKDLYYIERQTLTVNQAGAPFLYQTFSDEYSTTEDLNDTVMYTDGKEDDITVSPGTQVIVDKATDACYVHGELTPDEGFTVAFTLPVPVEGVSSPAYAITTEVNDLTNPGGYTGCKVTTQPEGKAKAGEQVTITAKPSPPGYKVVDSVTVTAADETTVEVKKTSGGVMDSQTYTFTMPDSDVTVIGVFRAPSNEFTLSPNPVKFEVEEGYTADDVEPQTVTITNTGDKDATFTGVYKIPATDANGCYVISPMGEGWGGTDGREITIAPGETATLTVRPKVGLVNADNPNSSFLNFSSKEGTWVKLSLACNVKQTPVYTMTAAPNALSFGQLYEGYTTPSGQAVTLTNTGTGTLNVTLPTSEHFTITPDASWNNGAVSLAPNGTATVTVTPKQGLTAGTYPDTLRFTTDRAGVKADVAVSVTVVSHENITITPADITVYTGGEGYTGAVDNAGNESTTANGLPEPGYYITLPDELNAILGGDANAEDLSEILKFTYKDDQGRTREWNLQLYGTDSHSSDVEDTERQRYIYRMLPGVDENEQEIPVRLQFTDSDGNVTISDEFTPNMEEQYQEYTMSIYSGELDPSKITAELDINGTTVTCGIESRDGDLVIRGLTSENITTDIVAAESNLNGSNISAVLPEGGVTYYINGSNVELNDTEGVRLLVDDVLDDGVLVEYIQNNMTEKVPAGDYAYEQQYLDLVDTKNGNAYLTMGEEDSLTIYWKVPDGFDPDKPFYVVHFDALDRNYDKLEDELSRNAPDLLAAQLVTVKGDQYVKFDTSSFSPFVLVWETQDVPPVPTVKLTYHANHGSEDTLTYYYTEPVVTVKDGLFTRFDYTFDSWNTNPDGTGTTYMPSSTIHVNGDMDLYAQWIKNNDSGHGGSDGGNSTQSEFELHYRTNGGKYLSVESESYVWTKAYEELPVPVREGYSFEGWYWDFRLTDPVRSDVKVDSPVVVLYAKWTEEKDASDLTGVSDWLDTIHHKAFLSGYPDGTFGPDRNMTRAEVAQMFYSLLLDKDVKITKTFTDVPADAWYAKAVNTLASLGMLGGYPDGTFQPDRTITRAEFAVVALAFTDGGSGDSCSFTDVNRNDWFYQYAAQASTYGWIGGYPDGSFRPNNKITRAEVSVIVNNMLGRDADKRFIDRNGDELVSFTDLTDGHWAYYAIMEATNTHTYTRDGSTEVWKAAT